MKNNWKIDHYGIVTGGDDGCTSICQTYTNNWRQAYSRAVEDGSPAADWIHDRLLESLGRDALIVNAPRMLAALKGLVNAAAGFIPHESPWNVEYESARDLVVAIAKATGEGGGNER